jgi:IS30 family transposase
MGKRVYHDIIKIEQWLNEGVTFHDISKRLNIAPSTLNRWLQSNVTIRYKLSYKRGRGPRKSKSTLSPKTE